MSYSTPTMVRMALVPSSAGAIPNPVSHTAADFTDQQLADAIAEADALIDAYIGGYYAVPVAAAIDSSGDEDGTSLGDIPHPIDYWSRNIAAYNASLSYRQSQDFPDTDPVARRYTATMAALMLVSKGQAQLQIPGNTGNTATESAGAPLNPYSGDLFGPCDFGIGPAYGPTDDPDIPYYHSGFWVP